MVPDIAFASPRKVAGTDSSIFRQTPFSNRDPESKQDG